VVYRAFVAGDTKHIYQSLVANAAIVVAKAFAAFMTGSGSMLAETIHSGADCGNQLLLLVGVKQGQKPADKTHPLGYGRNVYFWSFMVALLLFSGGGVFAIYEGVHKIIHPEPIESFWLGFGILAFSIVVEGYATFSNVRELDERRGAKPFFRYLTDTKDSDLVVVFGENAAATLGLALAMASLAAAYTTKKWWLDGLGSVAIGLVLVVVAVFLAREVKALLVGEAADPEIELATRQIVKKHPHFEELLEVITMQQGPGEVMVAMKVRLSSTLTSVQVCGAINEFEVMLRKRRPEAKWVFIEPDLPAVDAGRGEKARAVEGARSVEARAPAAAAAPLQGKRPKKSRR